MRQINAKFTASTVEKNTATQIKVCYDIHINIYFVVIKFLYGTWHGMPVLNIYYMYLLVCIHFATCCLDLLAPLIRRFQGDFEIIGLMIFNVAI